MNERNLWACPFRAAWSFITGRPLVALIDHNGEVNIRVAKRNALNQLSAKRMGFGIANVTLAPDGSTRGCCFVTKWVLLSGKAYA